MSPKTKEKKKHEDRLSIKGLQMRRSTSLNDVVRASVSKKASDKTDPRYRVEVWALNYLKAFMYIYIYIAYYSLALLSHRNRRCIFLTFFHFIKKTKQKKNSFPKKLPNNNRRN